MTAHTITLQTTKAVSLSDYEPVVSLYDLEPGTVVLLLLGELESMPPKPILAEGVVAGLTETRAGDAVLIEGKGRAHFGLESIRGIRRNG